MGVVGIENSVIFVFILFIMNALRKIVKSNGGSITINLPEEYQKTSLEIIILPFFEKDQILKDSILLNKAHEAIDAGCPDLNLSFIKSFENSLKDRELPLI